MEPSITTTPPVEPRALTSLVPRQTKVLSTPAFERSIDLASHVASGLAEASPSRASRALFGKFHDGPHLPERASSPRNLPRLLQRAAAARRTRRTARSLTAPATVTTASMSRCKVRRAPMHLLLHHWPSLPHHNSGSLDLFLVFNMATQTSYGTQDVCLA